MAALRRSSSSSSAPSMTWPRKGFLVFDSLDLGGLICLLICLIKWSLVWPLMMNVFVSTIGFVRCGSFSWLKGEPPGTRTLAACRQKNDLMHPRRASLPAEQRIYRRMTDFHKGNVSNTTPIPRVAGETWRCRYAYGYGLDDSDLPCFLLWPERTDLGYFEVVDCGACDCYNTAITLVRPQALRLLG